MPLPWRSQSAICANKRCGVYVMYDPRKRLIKVGLSLDPHVRGKSLGATLLYTEWLPNTLYAALAETAAHGALAEWWYDGEWFFCDFNTAAMAVKNAADSARRNSRLPLHRLTSNVVKIMPADTRGQHNGQVVDMGADR